jgi:hypothetical protein
MDVFVVDDSAQRTPTRAGMGPLVAAGGIHVPSESVRDLERKLAALCTEVGFPDGEEFKWSPDRRQWMYRSLKFDARERFFLTALAFAAEAGVTAIICINDTQKATATGTQTHEEDVITLLLERADHLLVSKGAQALVVVDRPSGNRAAETRYLAQRLETINTGTEYVSFERVALVLATESRLVRLLQLADLVVSCTLQYVAGEAKYAPAVFEQIKPLLRSDYGRIGGAGLKIHPDYRYANLYLWLCGDTHFVRFQSGYPLPLKTRPYATSPAEP